MGHERLRGMGPMRFPALQVIPITITMTGRGKGMMQGANL